MEKFERSYGNFKQRNLHASSVKKKGIKKIKFDNALIDIQMRIQNVCNTIKKRIKKGNKQKFYQRIKRSVLIALVICFLVITGTFAYYAKDLPSPNKINARNVAESTKIYDRTGEVLLYEIHGEIKRTLVSLDQISDYVIKATIACEDQDFYKHHGFDLRGILRAALLNIRGENLQGGSTITQQFVKNSILTSERTFARKIKELILAIEMELRFSKNEILQMYLNEIPYGSNAYGIEAASETFFGKKAKDLTLAESALLAALPKAPTYYSPFGNHPEELKARQEWILDRMVEEEFITREEADQAKKEKLKFVEKKENIIAPHFVLYVKDQLVSTYGEKFIQEGGLKVYTTLDINLQRLAEKVIAEGVERNKKYNAQNAALSAIDPKTGHILAMQGSKDYFDKENDGNVNVAIRNRQPGSSFKPYAYAAAFKKGYTPKTIIFDLETDFGENYKPRNYNLVQYGPVTMKKALAGSLNIASVKTLYLAGIDDTINLAQQLGITTLDDRERYGLSLVLGGGEVKLLDHVAAFSVFAADGIKHKKTAILRIIDQNGKTLEDNSKNEGNRVLDSQIARLISDILSDNQARSFVFGARNYLTLGSRPVAAKTGTTQEFRDAWTIGYTPSLAAGVWVGNNDNSKMKNGAAGAVVAAPIWHDFMEEALAGQEIESFPKPEPVQTKKPILNGQLAQEVKVTVCLPSEKLATDQCPEHLREERVYKKVHTILYYVDRNNPQGPYPANPQKDPQFARWEAAVQAWAKAQGYKDEEPPKDYDELHEAKNQPVVKILTPKDGDKITSSPMTIKAEASAPLGMKKVEFYLDNIKIGSDNSPPYQISYDVLKVTNGNHALIVRAFDRVDNQGETNISIDIKVSRPPIVSLISPGNGSILTKADFPYRLKTQIESQEDIIKVDFFAVNLEDNSTDLLASLTPSDSDQEQFLAKWDFPGRGTYQVYSGAVNVKGQAGFSQKATVEVK